MLRRTIASFRAMRVGLHVAYGLMIALPYPHLPASLRRRILQSWSAGLLDILNVRIGLAADDALRRLRSGLIVTNHISWLDIYVLNAVVPMRFVAKSEVRGWPLIGWLCERAGTLFIERGKARAAARMNVQLTERLRNGECLAVFPEGTTTDGTQVAHFHASLLQPAIDAAAPIHPITLRYQDKSGMHSTAAAYVDELSFGASMWNILCTPQLHVRLIATPALDASTLDRRALAHAARDRIAAALATADSHKLHIVLTPAQHMESNLLPSTR